MAILLTPNLFPYPDDSEKVTHGAAAIGGLASAVDTRLRTSAAGTLTLSTTASTASATATVTFPANRFNAPPAVTLVSNNNQYFGFMGTATAASTTLGVIHRQGSTGAASMLCHWHAIAIG